MNGKNKNSNWYKNKIEYTKKYVKENIKQVNLFFNRGNEEDMKLLDFLNNIQNKQVYIKNLIRADMEK